MKPALTRWSLVLALAALPVSTMAHVPSKDTSAAAFHDAMRKLWTDHVAWTRMYIISAAGNLPDLKATTDRLLQNQSDIGNAVAEYYGADAGTKLTALLKEHILQAATLVGAVKNNENAKAADTKTAWYRNADSIAAFLAGANPKHWPEAALKDAMKTHLDQTLEEAADRIGGKYDEDVKDYDAVLEHILKMADMLSSGIVAQFPAKFTGPKP